MFVKAQQKAKYTGEIHTGELFYLPNYKKFKSVNQSCGWVSPARQHNQVLVHTKDLSSTVLINFEELIYISLVKSDQWCGLLFRVHLTSSEEALCHLHCLFKPLKAHTSHGHCTRLRG